jgi:hypothetical protein
MKVFHVRFIISRLTGKREKGNGKFLKLRVGIGKQ